jgi:ribose transport system substrate-binding protein
MSRNPTHRRRRAVALGSVIASLALLGACAQNDGPGTAAGGTAEDSNAGVEQAKSHMDELAGPLTAASYPKEPALSNPVDMTGKKVLIVALGDNIPVIHGGAVGAGEALKALGATSEICDGKFTPTVVADCLHRAVDRRYDAVVTTFIDYAMAGAAFDEVEKAGIPVLLGGVAAPPDKKPSATLAFYDNTPRVNLLYQAMAEAAIATVGEDTNALWLRLTDSTTTTNASDAGIDRFEKLCPSCGLASTDFATANIDKMPGAVSAALLQHPDTNVLVVPVDSFVPPAMQGVQSAGLADKVKVVSSSSDLAGLQRVKAGEQSLDIGTSVIYEGWKLVNALEQLLAGDEVQKGDTMVSRVFTPDNVGDLTLDEASYFTTSWFGDDSFKDAFLTAWGVK